MGYMPSIALLRFKPRHESCAMLLFSIRLTRGISFKLSLCKHGKCQIKLKHLTFVTKWIMVQCDLLSPNTGDSPENLHFLRTKSSTVGSYSNTLPCSNHVGVLTPRSAVLRTSLLRKDKLLGKQTPNPQSEASLVNTNWMADRSDH